MKIVNISTHSLVDFLLRRGSIDNRVYNKSSMAEGTRIHLRYQQMQNGSYLSEQELICTVDYEDYEFIISGRADGIILRKDYPIIDEIKSTVMDLNEFYNEQKDWHLGQAKLYAYMYAKEKELDTIGVRLTYISQRDEEDKLILNFKYDLFELEKFVVDLITQYMEFYRQIDAHIEERISSSNSLEFPFKEYRKGQRELAKYVYGTIINDDTLFIEAPTGIGKTMSTLFPAVKTFSCSNTDKIFYLSAKKVAKEVAFEASKILVKKGLKARCIKFSSKEKMCMTDLGHCNPDECPFALGYYNKIKEVLNELINNEDIIDETVINSYAIKYTVCPFELQLDASLFSDIIICDYNYLFDPLVYLKRYFDDAKTNYVALIDETHNLVDRSRDMYSTSISLKTLLNVKYKMKKLKHPKFKKALKKGILYLSEFSEGTDIVMVEGNIDVKLNSILNQLFKQGQDILKNYQSFVNEDFLNFFREVNEFLKISEYVSNDFKMYYERTIDDVIVNIRCVDSSKLIAKTLKKLKSAVFFSATLTPIDYYVKCLGGNESTPVIKLESPFPSEHLLTLVRNDISTRYRDRELSYKNIALTIESVIKKRKGNYLVFFSSYQYLENVYMHLNLSDDINCIKQTRDMTDGEREEFLSHFVIEPNKTTLGLAVLGGVFSEGIDLVADKLIGSIIVGVGLPQISFERDLIKEHFDEQEMNGYDYSYVNPGITKIIQAAGRVIRSEKDIGVVVFIDDRYTYSKYRDIINKQYKNCHYVSSINEIERKLTIFWQDK